MGVIARISKHTNDLGAKFGGLSPPYPLTNNQRGVAIDYEC